MDVGWGFVAERLMKPLLVVEEEIGFEAMVSLSETGTAFEINLYPAGASYVLHRSPEPLHKNVIKSSPLAVLRNLNVFSLQDIRESWAGKLAALVGIENLGMPEFKGIFQSIQTKLHLQGI
jgi:hypothetical protein